MADHELWRKNLPEGYDGRQGEKWDDEVEMGPIIWSTVAITLSVVVAFAFCWWLIIFLEGMQPEPELSPIAEFNERRFPPRPWIQPSPEAEMDDWLEQMSARVSGYGWSDQLEGLVHIPVEEAKSLVLAGAGAAQPAVEPAVDQPLDVEAPPVEGAASEPGDNPASEPGDNPASEPGGDPAAEQGEETAAEGGSAL